MFRCSARHQDKKEQLDHIHLAQWQGPFSQVHWPKRDTKNEETTSVFATEQPEVLKLKKQHQILFFLIPDNPLLNLKTILGHLPCCGRPLCLHYFHQFHQFHQYPRWTTTSRCPAAWPAMWPLPLLRGAKECTHGACGAGVEQLRKMRPKT